MSAASLTHSLIAGLNKLVSLAPKTPAPYRLFNVHLKQRIAISPSLTRLVFTGADIEQMTTRAADQRIKLFFPAPDGSPSELPLHGNWQAARRALPESKRPAMRTYTIRALHPQNGELEVDFVLHGVNGPASAWATHAALGAPLQIVAPNREHTGDAGGYEWQPPFGIRQVLLIGDETALPAIAGILEQLAAQPDPPRVEAFIEVPHADDCLELPCGPETRLHWMPRDRSAQAHGQAMIEAARTLANLPPPASSGPGHKPAKEVDIDRTILWDRATPTDRAFYAWVAGESAAVMAIRRYLLNERGLDRRALTLMGYWRLGRSLE